SLTPPSPTAPHTPPLHDALPISTYAKTCPQRWRNNSGSATPFIVKRSWSTCTSGKNPARFWQALPGSSFNTSTTPIAISSYTPRSEEHTSELQSRENLVCRLLLE